MRAVYVLTGSGWLLFWIYWFANAFRAKRGRIEWRGQIAIRVAIVAVALILVRTGIFRHTSLNSDVLRGVIGLAIFAAGLAFAVWARIHIGRNWGTPMTRKDDPELVTSGPYRMVRHPIYSGILLAGVGTAIAISWVVLFGCALAGIYFVYAAHVEERIMAEEFPEAYRRYRASTKMLVPFLF